MLPISFHNPLTSGADYARHRFFDEIRPGDNLIPLIFADRIYAHDPVRPFCCGDWLSSDRPPLQSGIVLLERPIHLLGNKELDYELLSAGLQCLWVCGVWCLLTALRVSEKRILQTLVFLVFSGFLFYNSVFTWPKLLAATCILLALSIVIDVILRQKSITSFEIVLAAMSIGSALMSHPGSIFSLAAFALLLFTRFRGLFLQRRLIIGLLVLMAYALPWSAYQKFVDPPGNRLIKMHLAGEVYIDSRSTWQGIRDAYTTHSLKQIVNFKLSNLALLMGKKPLDALGLNVWSLQGGVHIDHRSAEESRIAQREWIWNAVGVLNVGWLVGLFILSKRRKKQLAVPLSGWLIAAALINFVFWSLVTFGPGETVTTHSSYADIFLLSLGLMGFILTVSRAVYLVLLAWQIFNFFFVWVCLPAIAVVLPGEVLASTVQFPLLIIGPSIATALLWLAVCSTRNDFEASAPVPCAESANCLI